MLFRSFIREDHGKLTPEGLRVRTLARFAGAVWAMATLGSIFLELANILDVPLVNTFDHLVLRSFLFQTALGNSLFINFAAAISVSLLLIFVRKNSGALLLLGLTFIGLIAPLFESHSTNGGNHGLAIGSLIFHVEIGRAHV